MTFNDSIVTPMQESEVVTSAAYVLFYKRREFQGVVSRLPTGEVDGEFEKAMLAKIQEQEKNDSLKANEAACPAEPLPPPGGMHPDADMEIDGDDVRDLNHEPITATDHQWAPDQDHLAFAPDADPDDLQQIAMMIGSTGTQKGALDLEAMAASQSSPGEKGDSEMKNVFDDSPQYTQEQLDEMLAHKLAK